MITTMVMTTSTGEGFGAIIIMIMINISIMYMLERHDKAPMAFVTFTGAKFIKITERF